MTVIDLPRLGRQHLKIDWENPGGAGNQRLAIVTLSDTGFASGSGFRVALPDDGRGSDQALRIAAFKAILPAAIRLRQKLRSNPAERAFIEVGEHRVARYTVGASVGFEIVSEDGRRRVQYVVELRHRLDDTDEHPALRFVSEALGYLDKLISDLEHLVDPGAVGGAPGRIEKGGS